MPSLPAGLVDWLQPGAIGAGLAIVWTEVRAQGKRIDQLRDDMKASEERQRQDMAELRAEHKADNRALNEKLDRLVEALLTAKQP